MRQYELTYLISDEVLEKDQKNITDQVAGIISDASGKVTKEESWGRRKLAYPIKKQNFATYVTAWFGLPADKIPEISHELLVLPKVIRHLIVVKVAKGEELAVTREDIVGTEDVEKAIGEKSFEVVEGKKDESYKLMAKRTGAEEKPAVEKIEKPKRKAVKKIEKKPTIKKPVEAEPRIEPKVEKPESDEADRIKKLDEKLDELLKDDL